MLLESTHRPLFTTEAKAIDRIPLAARALAYAGLCPERFEAACAERNVSPGLLVESLGPDPETWTRLKTGGTLAEFGERAREHAPTVPELAEAPPQQRPQLWDRTRATLREGVACGVTLFNPLDPKSQ